MNSGTSRNNQDGSYRNNQDGLGRVGREQDKDRAPQRSSSSQDSNYTGSSHPQAYVRAASTPSNGPSTPNSARQDLHGMPNGCGEWTSQRSHLTPENGSNKGNNA